MGTDPAVSGFAWDELIRMIRIWGRDGVNL